MKQTLVLSSIFGSLANWPFDPNESSGDEEPMMHCELCEFRFTKVPVSYASYQKQFYETISENPRLSPALLVDNKTVQNFRPTVKQQHTPLVNMVSSVEHVFAKCSRHQFILVFILVVLCTVNVRCWYGRIVYSREALLNIETAHHELKSDLFNIQPHLDTYYIRPARTRRR